ncbi:hypothetical protein CH333_00785 [candidate division WOR-3 bacterium JGI_Cruoil_03_44_89]|uniref:Uncharacterized protein n=1 Tax=candidate division WOR-3 bacterium JGI_Cruoil_03_44_89 TaxID=1973748 RepID=A0A235BZ61_UNCW3|nr:MAG: hypothetical protein CH333_00785 [candidate division WOR-3 bacterium JGI_Cruoil_03_44_89]
MNIPAISRSRTEGTIKTALTIWRHNTLRELGKRLEDIWGDEFASLYEFGNEPLRCAVFGSGTFSTGRYEIYIARELEKELGWAPVRYTLVVTNSKKSRAGEAADEFGLPLVQLDFSSWYRENYDSTSEKPISETSLFKPGELIAQKFNIRAEFDGALRDIIEKSGGLPDLISLRGYNFPVMYTLLRKEKKLIDDTHPADLSLTDRAGVPLCPGWQVGAVRKMRNCGCTTFRSSLIEVKPFFSVSDVTSLDAGKIYALSPGIKPPSSWSTKKIQENMKRTEDYFLCAIKATGLFPYMWGISKKKYEVEYVTKEGEVVTKSQPAIIVGEQIRCGRNAFGGNMKDISLPVRPTTSPF